MTWLVALSVLLLLTPSPALAAERDEDRQALRAVAKAFEDSIRQRDLARFQAVLDPAFVGVMVTNEVVDRNSIKTFWDWAWGLIGPKGTWTVEVAPQPATFYGDLAVAHGTARDHIVSERGQDWRFTWNWTAVFRKSGNDWKLIAGHGSMDPLGNVFVRAEASWIKGIFGGGGLVLGLVVGVLGAWLVGRARRPGRAA